MVIQIAPVPIQVLSRTVPVMYVSSHLSSHWDKVILLSSVRSTP